MTDLMDVVHVQLDGVVSPVTLSASLICMVLTVRKFADVKTGLRVLGSTAPVPAGQDGEESFVLTNVRKGHGVVDVSINVCVRMGHNVMEYLVNAIAYLDGWEIRALKLVTRDFMVVIATGCAGARMALCVRGKERRIKMMQFLPSSTVVDPGCATGAPY